MSVPNVQFPDYDISTTDGVAPTNHGLNNIPQINISGHARVQLGDRINAPTTAEKAEDEKIETQKEKNKKREALERAKQKELNARIRLQNFVAVLQFTLHWADVLRVYADRSDNDLAAAIEAFVQVDDIPALFRRRFQNDSQRAVVHKECLSKRMFVETVQSCTELIDRFEAIMQESTNFETLTDARDRVVEVQELQIKTVAGLLVILW